MENKGVFSALAYGVLFPFAFIIDVATLFVYGVAAFFVILFDPTTP